MAGLFEPVEKLAEDVVEEVTGGIIKPRPGGFMDRWEKEQAQREADADQAKNDAEPIQQAAYHAVKTAPESPEIFAATTITVPANQPTLILPFSPYRYRSSLLLNPQYIAQQSTTIPVVTPAVPGSAAAIQNPYPFAVTVVISGGTATATTINGQLVGPGDGTYIVPAAGSISVTYSVAPTWAWSLAAPGSNVFITTPASQVNLSVILAINSSQALGGVGYTLPSGISLAIFDRAQLWAYSATQAVTLSVISELYAPKIA